MMYAKHVGRACIAALVVALAICAGSVALYYAGGVESSTNPRYAQTLFDTSYVHAIDIEMDDWESFIASATDEEYAEATLVIDNTKVAHVGIRAKGNTSLTSVSEMGSERYSFKIEFDHYVDGRTYDGLDKLNLNNLIFDATMMKDYVSYQLMNEFGVDAPLSSFANVSVNGENFGLYVAVEGVEESFLNRTHNGVGNLYKPDTSNNKGGAGDVQGEPEQGAGGGAGTPEQGGGPGAGGGAGGGAPGDQDGDVQGTAATKLQYIDDELESYSDIFDSAKTDVTQEDKERLVASLKQLSQYNNVESVVDIDQVLRYMVVHNFVVNDDSYTGGIVHNYYLYENAGKLAMIPWDYNLAFGAFHATSAVDAINDPIDDVLEDRPLQAWIFSDATYTAQYHELYQQFLDSCNASALIEQARDLIAPYVAEDPTQFYSYSQFEDACDALLEFVALRAQSVEGQLAGTIPSTSAEQTADTSALVQPGNLSLETMGSMGGGGAPSAGDGGLSAGGGGPGGGEGGAPSGAPPAGDDGATFSGTPPNAPTQL